MRLQYGTLLLFCLYYSIFRAHSTDICNAFLDFSASLHASTYLYFTLQCHHIISDDSSSNSSRNNSGKPSAHQNLNEWNALDKCVARDSADACVTCSDGIILTICFYCSLVFCPLIPFGVLLFFTLLCDPLSLPRITCGTNGAPMASARQFALAFILDFGLFEKTSIFCLTQTQTRPKHKRSKQEIKYGTSANRRTTEMA